MKKKKLKWKERLHRFFHRFAQNVKANKVSFVIYVVMIALTVSVMIISFLRGHFESVFTAFLSLILFLLPTFVEESFRIKLPMALEIVAVLFVFCANILGEIGAFYTYLPFWDDMLHYVSGFIFAAFGFSLVDILNRNGSFDFHLSPIFLSLVALCFAVTVGVVWEFFEFSADTLLRTDMQKDTIVQHIYSAELNPDGQAPIRIYDIEQTVITAKDGSTYTVDGYLDVGVIDTVKDLFIDFAGAFLFAVFGYFYTSGSSKKAKIVGQFVPRVSGDGEESEVSESLADGESK